MTNNENKNKFPSVCISWVSRIYGKPLANTYKIRKSSKKVFTHLDDFIVKGV